MDARDAGRYRLLDRIGSGGMAEVWRATDLDTGETVAVKRLHPHLTGDPAARSRFRREIDAARSVGHPLAVRVRDAGEDDAGPWLVMEHVAGGPLSERLRQGRVPESEAVPIAADVAEVLASLHAAGMVHRDVTPSNILIGEDGRARLGDFGIARRYDSTALEDVTAPGDVVGTFRFLAPEVLAGRPASPASDTWSLGAVLFEMLAGTSPFDVSSPAALLASQALTLPPLPPVDESVARIVHEMLSPDPAARPTAGQAVLVLARGRQSSALDDDPTVVMPAFPPAHSAVVPRGTAGAGDLTTAGTAAGSARAAVESSAPRPWRPPGADVRPVPDARSRGGTSRRAGPVLAIASMLLLLAVMVLAAGPPGGNGLTEASATPVPTRSGGAASPPPKATPAPLASSPGSGNPGHAGKSVGAGKSGEHGKHGHKGKAPGGKGS